jgi:peptidoglycan-N-acetylglucosamine deacetylase
VKGFHYPTNKWSLGALKELTNYDYSYDVVYQGKKRMKTTSKIRIKDKEIIRLFTAGDDWQMYVKDVSEDEVFRYFSDILNKIHDRDGITGIGFHPWVLFSDPAIFNGFCRFLRFISSRQDVCIRTALEFVTELNSHQKVVGL